MIKIENINKKLRAERLKRNLTYEDMADLLGYKSRSTYMYIERGFTEPRLEVMNKIATIFNKPVSYFFNIKVQES